MAFDGPKFMMETIKDPKKQVEQLQDQIQDQIEQVKGGFSQKLELNSWLAASKNDYQQIMQTLGQLSRDIADLNEKVDQLSKNND